MAGDCPGKTRIENVDVFIHEPNDNDGTTTVHIDVEHPLLAEILDGGSTYCGGKGGGAFIGLKTEQGERAEEIAANLRLQRGEYRTDADADTDTTA